MEKFEKTIGEIKVNTGIACQSVLDMKITSMEGMHGTLAITFETDEGTAPDAVRGLKDMPVTVSLGDGTRLLRVSVRPRRWRRQAVIRKYMSGRQPHP